jgi:AraC-like DNA-binding protein
MQVIDDVLSAMRLAGGVILDCELRGEWAIHSSFPAPVCSQFFPVRGSLISYHYVREGELSARASGSEETKIGPGSILLFPQNVDHRLFNSDLPPIRTEELVLPPEDDGPALLRLGEGEPVVRLYCGFLSATSHENPVLEHLPPLLVVHPDDARAAWVDASMRFAAEEAHDDPVMVGRLAELMFAEAVQVYLESNAEAQRLAAGMSDPAIARALEYIHGHFANDIEVDEIAKEAGVSKTVLGERFLAVMGEPPIRYSTRCRMRKATDLLDLGLTTDEVAHAVGFSSAAAFTRAFKREYGEPPATWRRHKVEPLSAV